MITINSNSSALMAQNNLFKSQAALTGNMQQLSTGLRINSASDDAAGLQISNRMETQMNGLSVAQRNANDAISMAQTAEGAMTENTTMLNRMRDLSLQSANDTNTAEDRASMQQEVDSLISEVDRVATTTNFAGINLLDGSAENMTFQIGAGAAETISFGIGDMSASALQGEVSTSADITAALIFGSESDDDLANDPDALGKDQTLTISYEGGDEGNETSLTIDLKEGMGRAEIADAINTQLDSVGAVVGDDNTIVLTGSGLSGYDTVTGDEGGTAIIETNMKSVSGVDLNSAIGAQEAVQILDGALAQVDNERANLGAVQNRLESTISNLSNIEENLGVAQSRILDADFASQTVEMTSNQMLMQAGTSVLAQAKAMPQYATMLL